MFAIALLVQVAVQAPAPSYDGRARQLNVQPPRIDTSITIDGELNEPVWSRAARLTGFSQYQPVDGRPAEEPTEVLVWYGPDAIYFGIRAQELHGDVVRATRANRDNIGSEDQVQILLDTYNDHRLAFLFGVNPLGIQQDGTRSDAFSGGAGGGSGTGGGVGINFLDGNVDLNPDYVFESRGRLVAGGYEVEIRIPFKSLRYGEGATQHWGVNVLRRTQHSGFQDSWTPALRGQASFLGQSGVLEGMHDLKRGLVLEMTPTLTQRVDGTPAAAPATTWDYHGWSELGGDVRWGITQNLSLNGTYQPDFSQVEADVGQVVLNERFALFYPEKRPFFLDGLELFDTPNQLIYTRQIADPDGGAKLAGKIGRTTLATLFAADNQSEALYGGTGRPLFGVARVRRDIGRNSTFGLVGTTREDGNGYSRLAGADVRLYHSQLYFVELQAVQSWSKDPTTRSGPLFEAQWDRTGRAWGFNYSARAVAPDFQAAAGFVNRTNIIDVNIFNRFTIYGAQDAFLQTATAFVGFERIWHYDAPEGGSFEGLESISPSATLRGGWQVSSNLSRRFYSFDPADYTGYETIVPVAGPALDTVPFAVPGPERNLFNGTLRLTTPTYRLFTASFSAGYGETPIFKEAQAGRQAVVSATVDARPTTALRVAFQLSGRTIDRDRDGSRYSTETIPRLKVEYQLTRSIFFRFVGQYTARNLDSLQDGNGHPVLINGAAQPATKVNEFRTDWLFSYRPIPGTLVYLGYGATLDEPDAFAFDQLHRTTDGFFGKISYLFRL